MLDNAAYITSLDKNTLYGTGIAIAAGLYVLSQAADYIIKKGEFSFYDQMYRRTEQYHKVKEDALGLLNKTNNVIGKIFRLGGRKAAKKYLQAYFP